MNEEEPLPPKKGVDPEDIRKALEAHARKRPPRPPATAPLDEIPRLYVKKPLGRKRRKP